MELISLWQYSILSVLLVSIVSFIGVFTLSVKQEKLQKILIYLVSFSTGALFGDAFIHLIPEIAKHHGLGIKISLSLLGGILIFFVLEKFVRWRHCHSVECEEHHPKHLAYMNLIGDGMHNFIDGAIIAASYIVSPAVGIATTTAIILHEIPQEIGDFAVLLHAGFTRKKALLFNFLSAAIAVLGTVTVLITNRLIEGIEFYLVPIAAGGFIYIAGSDLIPELHKKTGLKESILQLIMFILGIAVMALLLLIG